MLFGTSHAHDGTVELGERQSLESFVVAGTLVAQDADGNRLAEDERILVDRNANVPRRDCVRGRC